MDYIIKLTEQQAQLVLNALAELPFKNVFEVIDSIQKQAVEQKQKVTNNG